MAVHQDLAGLVREELPDLPAANLLEEPEAKDTAPAAVRAAWHLAREDADQAMVILPADHWVEDEEAFQEVMLAAAEAAVQEDALVCIGVPALGPATGFGYLVSRGGPFRHALPDPILRFVEKPDLRRAEGLLKEGSCAWNAGIFVWRAGVFLEETLRLSKELGSSLEQLRADSDIGRFFGTVPAISIDRAILEHTERAWAVGAEMGWDDVGSWNAVARHMGPDAAGNSGVGERIALESRDCLVRSPDKPVVLLGVEKLIIVECDDVLLVAHRDRAQDVRNLPELLRAHGLGELI